MLDRKYGKCLSNLWQPFSKKFLKMTTFLAIFLFHYKMPIFGNIHFIFFAIYIFSKVLHFFTLTTNKRSVLGESKCVPSRGEHWAWTGSGLDILQDTCHFFGSGFDLDFFLNCIRIGSGYLFVFYNKISRRVMQDVTNCGGSVFFAMVFICTKNQDCFVSICCTNHNQ